MRSASTRIGKIKELTMIFSKDTPLRVDQQINLNLVTDVIRDCAIPVIQGRIDSISATDQGTLAVKIKVSEEAPMELTVD